MIFDTVEAFKALEHYGIRVASSKTQSTMLRGEDVAIVGRTDDSSRASNRTRTIARAMASIRIRLLRRDAAK